jgi:hypothetical protein
VKRFLLTRSKKELNHRNPVVFAANALGRKAVDLGNESELMASMVGGGQIPV